MNWLHYLLEANLYTGAFYLCYCLFLQKETFYVINRVYLLVTCLVSFIIPFIQIGMLKPAVPELTNLILTPVYYQQKSSPVPIMPVETHFDVRDAVLNLYILGVIVSLLLLTFKLYQVFSLTRAGNLVIKDGYKLIYIDKAGTAFSFFNYLFISRDAANQKLIINHEQVHIRQKHSLDILLLEILKAINWFNPVIYLLQNSLKNIHEYIADEKTAMHETDAFTYSDFLVKNAYGIGGPTIAHSFFNYNLLKKRIIMLHQKRSGSLARLKYLFILPLCAGLLCTSTLGFSKNYGWFDIAPGNSDKTKTLPVAKNDTLANATEEFKTTKKGYKYREDGYLIKNKTDFRVIIIDNGVEHGYFRNAATADQIKLLKDKYGYTFPTMKIYPMLPPPPPAPPMAAPVKDGKVLPPPPPMPPNVKKGASRVKMVVIDTIISKEAAANFSKYLGKYIRFPKIALDSNYSGRLIASFSVNSENKINNVVIRRSPAQCFSDETERVLEAYDGADLKPNTDYSVSVSFCVIDKKGNYIGGSSKIDPIYKPVKNTVAQGKNWMLDEVVVAAYK